MISMDRSERKYNLPEIVEIANQKGKLTLKRNLINSITTPFKNKKKHLIKFTNKESIVLHNSQETIEHINAKYKLNLFKTQFDLKNKLCFRIH